MVKQFINKKLTISKSYISAFNPTRLDFAKKKKNICKILGSLVETASAVPKHSYFIFFIS